VRQSNTPHHGANRDNNYDRNTNATRDTNANRNTNDRTTNRIIECEQQRERQSQHQRERQPQRERERRLLQLPKRVVVGEEGAVAVRRREPLPQPTRVRGVG
jgi:hypothetical protein